MSTKELIEKMDPDQMAKQLLDGFDLGQIADIDKILRPEFKKV